MRYNRRLKTGNEGWLTSYADLITNLIIFFIILISASEIQKGKLEAISQQISQKVAPHSLAEAEQAVREAIQRENLQETVQVKMTNDGLELSFNSGLTFASGQAAVLPQMEEPLSKVLKMLIPYGPNYQFAVEGHTDEVPIKSAVYRSNWELAAGRALEVRERLETVGISRDRVRVEAYADTRGLSAEEVTGLTRDQNLAKHRRVVVRLY